MEGFLSFLPNYAALWTEVRWFIFLRQLASYTGIMLRARKWLRELFITGLVRVVTALDTHPKED